MPGTYDLIAHTLLPLPETGDLWKLREGEVINLDALLGAADAVGTTVTKRVCLIVLVAPVRVSPVSAVAGPRSASPSGSTLVAPLRESFAASAAGPLTPIPQTLGLMRAMSVLLQYVLDPQRCCDPHQDPEAGVAKGSLKRGWSEIDGSTCRRGAVDIPVDGLRSLCIERAHLRRSKRNNAIPATASPTPMAAPVTIFPEESIFISLAWVSGVANVSIPLSSIKTATFWLLSILT